MHRITVTPSYTYDDVLIKPQKSDIQSRKNVCLKTKLTNNITLNIPIVSSNMDTITEDKMAIEIARLGGLGILHRYCTIKQQVEMVKKVKRYTNYLITDPYTAYEHDFMENVIHEIHKNNVDTLLIKDSEDKLTGIFTKRDMIDYNRIKLTGNIPENKDCIKDFMTKNPFSISKEVFDNMSINTIIRVMTQRKIQKLPILENNNKTIYGLVTLKDALHRVDKTFITKANLDENSQLVVGAAIGVNKDYLERADALIKAGCDIICVDVAHGHHTLCANAVVELRAKYPYINIIAGNVCTAEGVKFLAAAGADCIKVGVGPGSICTTRKKTGCGIPQFSAVLECSEQAKQSNVTIIADGGHNRTIGNIFKALCAGASACMLGGSLSGTLETPGLVYTKLDKKVKQIRGMAGLLANYNKSAKMGQDTSYLEDITPEGVEGYVPYKGPVKDIIQQIEGGVRSGMSYVGCSKLNSLKYRKIEFALITSNGFRESGSHNITEM